MTKTYVVYISPYISSEECGRVEALITGGVERKDGMSVRDGITVLNGYTRRYAVQRDFLRYQSTAIAPPELCRWVVEQSYQRVVGPRMLQIKKASVGCSEEYGELNFEFMQDIIIATGMGPSDKFLDIGSGVGTAVMHAVLLSGCSGTGIELMSDRADIAVTFSKELAVRCEAWGICSPNISLRQGNAADGNEIDKSIGEASVILVNNVKFVETGAYSGLHPRLQ